MTWGVLVLVALSSYRLTRLVTTDELTEPIRHRIMMWFPPRRGPVEDEWGKPVPGTARLVPSIPVTFIHCPWCVSVWTSLGCLLAAHFSGLLPSWQVLGISWLAVSTVAGLIARVGD